ncbi:hypothetical protein [Clavibacter michiganensis]|uniref:hypothetical protein n=1 Tax=Clavibacter michiganensis TaxID=28447 RepID=UPI003DA15B16
MAVDEAEAPMPKFIEVPIPKDTGPRGCYFCGSTPLTKEHILPNWINKIVGHDPGATNELTQKVRRAEGGLENQSRFLATPFLRQTVKAVCANCNNGWMSTLEQRVQQTLMHLSMNGETALDAGTAFQFARWAIKTSMMRGIWENRDMDVFPKENRTQLAGGNEIPEGWSVFIGATETAHLMTANWSYKWFLTETGEDETLAALQGTVRLFQLLVITCYVAPEEDAKDVRDSMGESPELQQVWPLRDVPIFPSKHIISEPEAQGYTELFRGIFDRDGALTGGYLKFDEEAVDGGGGEGPSVHDDE